MAREYNDYPGLVFVAGPARSGTTLISLVLSAHPDVCIAPENRFLPWYIWRYHKCPNLEARDLENVKEAIFADEKLARLKVDLTGFYRRVHSYEAGVPVSRIPQDFLRYYCEATGKSAIWLGQKKNFLEQWPAVRKMYPDAKLISIIRDCRESAWSASKNLPNQSVFSATLTWGYREYNTRRATRDCPESHLDLSYERFVADPRAVCVSICEFLNIDFSASMLKHYQLNSKGEQLISGYETKHKYTMKNISTSHINKYESIRPRFVTLFIEFLVGRQLRKRGYRMQGKRVPSLPLTLFYWMKRMYQSWGFKHACRFLALSNIGSNISRNIKISRGEKK